jgi:glycosyltransferase 2 family protein
MVKSIIKYVVSLGFAAALLFWTLKDYNFADNYEKLKNANFSWFFLSAFFTIIAHTSRAIRGKMLLEPLGYKPKTLTAALAVFLGYFANYIVPRLGEVTRCTSLNATDQVPFEKSFGTVITERIVDVFVLLLLLLINFFLEFDRLSGYFMDFFKGKFGGEINYGLIISAILCAIGIFITLIFIWKKQKAMILKNPIVSKIVGFGKGLLEGLLSIKNLKNPAAFIAHTVLIWTMYYFMTYVMFFALGETSNLGMLAGLSTLVMGAIGIAAPTPGGLGAYHALVGNLLVLYGLSVESGKTLAIFLHGSQMVITIVFGIISFVILFFIKQAKVNQPEISKI